MIRSIFLSHTYPDSPEQERNVALLRSWFVGRGVSCSCVGKAENAPLLKIRNAIAASDAVVAYAMPKPSLDANCVNSPWVHMEAAMAIQACKPVAILIDQSLPKVGMFDSKITGLLTLLLPATFDEVVLLSIVDEQLSRFLIQPCSHSPSIRPE